MVQPNIIYPFIDREVFAQERNVFAQERHVFYKPQYLSNSEVPIPPIPVGEEEDDYDDKCGRYSIN